jgi:hypothetical protein
MRRAPRPLSRRRGVYIFDGPDDPGVGPQKQKRRRTRRVYWGRPPRLCDRDSITFRRLGEFTAISATGFRGTRTVDIYFIS